MKDVNPAPLNNNSSTKISPLVWGISIGLTIILPIIGFVICLLEHTLAGGIVCCFLLFILPKFTMSFLKGLEKEKSLTQEVNQLSKPLQQITSTPTLLSTPAQKPSPKLNNDQTQPINNVNTSASQTELTNIIPQIGDIIGTDAYIKSNKTIPKLHTPSSNSPLTERLLKKQENTNNNKDNEKSENNMLELADIIGNPNNSNSTGTGNNFFINKQSPSTVNNNNAVTNNTNIDGINTAITCMNT